MERRKYRWWMILILAGRTICVSLGHSMEGGMYGNEENFGGR